MRKGSWVASSMAAVVLGACSKERPLPEVVDASAVTRCAYIGQAVGDPMIGRDQLPADRAARELAARTRGAALGATHVVWDTSANYKGNVVAAKLYRCQQ